MNPEIHLLREGTTWLSIVSQLFTSRTNRLLEPHGMTLVQFSILNHLARRRVGEGDRISDIADAVEALQPAVTKIIAKFERLGMVEVFQKAGDKRSKHVRISDKGNEILIETQKALGPELARIFSSLEPDEMESLVDLLQKLGIWLDKNRL